MMEIYWKTAKLIYSKVGLAVFYFMQGYVVLCKINEIIW